MPRRRRDPRWVSKLVLACARLLAWLADLAAILVMGYIIKCWPGNGGAVSAGIVGVRPLAFLSLPICHPVGLSQSYFPSLPFPSPQSCLGLVSENLTSSQSPRTRC